MLSINPAADNISINMEDDVYHHIVFQKAGTILKLYVDGTLTAEQVDFTSETCGTQNNDDDASLFVGRRNITNTNPAAYKGAVDELRIYSRSLTQTEIMWLSEM